MKLPIPIPARVTLNGIFVAIVGAVVVLALAIAAVQTARIEGFKVWPVNVQGWKPRALAAEARIEELFEDMTAAQAEAFQAQLDLRAAEQRDMEQLALEADRNEHATQRRASAAVEGFIAANPCPVSRGPVVAAAGLPAVSVRGAAPDRGDGGGAGAERAGDDPGLPAGMPADSFVSVRASDVRACAATTAYAISARSWALKLERVTGEGD